MVTTRSRSDRLRALGDRGPVLTIDVVGLALDVERDTAELVYVAPDGSGHSVQATITSPTSVEYQWLDGDLPVIGVYQALLHVVRSDDSTYPRTFPNSGARLLWEVFASL